MSEPGGSLADPAPPPSLMRFSEALDRVVKILLGNLRLFVHLATVPGGGLFATYALMFGGFFAFGLFPRPGQAPDPQRFVVEAFPIALLACVPMVVVYALFEAAVTQAALTANRDGRSSFSNAYGTAWQRLGRIVWLVLLRYLCIALPVAVLLAVVAFVVKFEILGGKSNLNPGLYFALFPAFLLGYLGSIVYAVWMGLRLGLAVPACLAEETTAAEALRRSAQLTRGLKGRMFLVILIEYAVSCAATLVAEMVGFAVVAVVGLIASSLHFHLIQPLAIAGIVLLGIAFFAAFFLVIALSWAGYLITFSVFYDSQRRRLEGAAPALAGGSAE